ncbi:putative ATP diphosphatase [Helianthus anomalus]
MEVLRLPLSASQKGKLISAGYTSIASLSSASPSHLALELKVSETEALEILKSVSDGSRLQSTSSSFTIVDGAQSAWDMLQEEETSIHITTSCADLDSILGGGISCKEVTEIGGVPGIGKTQLGIQLAVNVQIPYDYGGVGGKAIYIDTEGSFMVERALQIAEACSADMAEYSRLHHKGPQACEVKTMQPKDFLENIYYFRVCSYTEQIALTNYLDKFITEHKDVKVVIIDSITFHFRQDFDDMALRTRILSGMALNLMKLARKFGLAVVVLNQVTTKYADGQFHLALALGDSWSHSSTNRIILHWNGNERYAYIDKSPSLRSASAPYSVTPKGIRTSDSNNKRIKHV